MQISEVTPNEIINLSNFLDRKLVDAKCLEEAAQIFVNELYRKYVESIVLIRTFITIPADELPNEIQEFAALLLKNSDFSFTPTASMMILTLFGSYGELDEWNDRKQSKGHMGIPLISESFIRSIPMVSYMLEQLGFASGWIHEQKSVTVEKFGPLTGNIFVENASTAVDEFNRHIISNQEFVSNYHILSIFGFGGEYIGTGKFMATIIFTREYLNHNQILLFQTLANVFKYRTKKFLKNPRYYFELT